MTDVSEISSAVRDYNEHVNPQWVRLLDLLDLNVPYTRCDGVELSTADGRTVLDLSLIHI